MILRVPSWVAPSLLAALGAGCAASPRPPAARVAVLPPNTLRVAPQRAARMRAAIGREIARASGVVTVPERRVDAAFRAAAGCREEAHPAHLEQCAVQVGQAVAASHVVAANLGAVGRAHLVQLRLVEVARRGVSRTLEQTLVGDTESLAAATARLASRLFDQRPAQKRWYARWWVWTAIAAAAGAAVAIPVATASGERHVEAALP